MKIEKNIAFYDNPMSADLTLFYEVGSVPFSEELVKQYYDKIIIQLAIKVTIWKL